MPFPVRIKANGQRLEPVGVVGIKRGEVVKLEGYQPEPPKFTMTWSPGGNILLGSKFENYVPVGAPLTEYELNNLADACAGHLSDLVPVVVLCRPIPPDA